jgi:hypothetical protein
MDKIDRPIFILGCARSGTTIFHLVLGAHPDLAWFSNYTSFLRPFPQLAALSPLYDRFDTAAVPKRLRALIPKPFEGQQIWNHFLPTPMKPLTAADLTKSDAARIKQAIHTHLRYHNRPRFMNKNISTLRRVGYFNALFPDAYFVHLVHDPRATAASLLNWKISEQVYQTWNAGKYDPADWESVVEPAFNRVIQRWIGSNQRIIEHEPTLGDRYLRIYYENFTANPQAVLKVICEHCALPFTPEHMAIIEEKTAPLVQRMGHDYFAEPFL